MSGLTVKIVAPNSPRLMVKAKIAPATRAFEISGRSIVLNIFNGDAPNIDAASVKFCGIDLNAGKMVKELGSFIQGGGGGQPFYATAGGKNPQGIKDALLEARAILS